MPLLIVICRFLTASHVPTGDRVLSSHAYGPKALIPSCFSLPVPLNLSHILIRLYNIHLQASLNLPRSL
jgi:hypothetical protein